LPQAFAAFGFPAWGFGANTQFAASNPSIGNLSKKEKRQNAGLTTFHVELS
jgi:hypothetical protein